MNQICENILFAQSVSSKMNKAKTNHAILCRFECFNTDTTPLQASEDKICLILNVKVNFQTILLKISGRTNKFCFWHI